MFSNGSDTFNSGIGSDDDCTFPLMSMFAEGPEVTYTRLEWQETLNDVTSTIASLDKSFTISEEGTALEMTGFSATPSQAAEGCWDFVIEVNAEVDPNGRYILLEKNLDGNGSGSTTLWVEDGRLTATTGSSSYETGVNFYVIKMSA